MRALVIVLGILVVITVMPLGLFTVGEIPTLFLFLLVVAAVVYGFIWGRRFLTWITAAFGVLIVGSILYGGYSTLSLLSALANNDGPVDAADPVALESATAKLDAADGSGGFRVEMTVAELGAVLQDTLAGSDSNPFRRVDLEVVDGKDGGQGTIKFRALFKKGGVTADGAISASVNAGEVDFRVDRVHMGNFTLPGFARSAVETLIESATDVNKTLAAHGAEVQSVAIGEGRVVVVGLTGGGELVTLGTLMTAVSENVAALGDRLKPPAARVPPGVVDALEHGSAPYYVALGDSLAANVGVDAARDGYVSRFHNQLQLRDGKEYGLRNFGVSGQTSGGLIRDGQLSDAIAFMKATGVAYVTIDIGANDLLGHLYSPDCSETVTTPACQERLELTLAGYEGNLRVIFRRVKEAAPGATVVFLGMYNPFSIGFGADVGLEAETDAVVQRVNALARGIAAENGARYADGFGVIQGRAGAVTHMLDATPDVHPLAIGYDLLTLALVAALE
ncbi:MAG: hypothetical protein HY875_05855 [Chloroflexi bacterium]|nr:hypothetical protein [Chloroflexota bacterium]